MWNYFLYKLIILVIPEADKRLEIAWNAFILMVEIVYVYFTNIINLALHRELSRTIETIRCQWDFDFLLEFNKKSKIALQCEF